MWCLAKQAKRHSWAAANENSKLACKSIYAFRSKNQISRDFSPLQLKKPAAIETLQGKHFDRIVF